MKFLKWMGFDPEKHSVSTEILAGLTTFLTMAYILAVNPNVFDALGGEMSKANTPTILFNLFPHRGNYTVVIGFFNYYLFFFIEQIHRW